MVEHKRVCPICFEELHPRIRGPHCGRCSGLHVKKSWEEVKAIRMREVFNQRKLF